MMFDRIDNRVLPQRMSAAQKNGLNSLRYLAAGLAWLAAAVQEQESKLLSRLPAEKRVTLYGNHPALEAVPMGLLACTFHWYAVSVCNFVRLAGWLTDGGSGEEAPNYVKAVIPKVKLWRDKVGAHFAIASPLASDTEADLLSSVLFPIAFDDDRFVASPFTLSFGGASPSTSSLEQWSVTGTHAELVARFPLLSPPERTPHPPTMKG